MEPTRLDILREMGYSERALHLIRYDTNIGSLKDPSAYARHQGGCGDILDLYLDVEDGIIRDAKYQHVGCMGLQASAAGLCEMIRGMRVDDAMKIDVTDIVNYLGGIPKLKYDCAELARDTLRKALRDIPVAQQ
jgi:nitrogen fixation NifU-like protein